jgi:hypothetical protein
MAGQRIPQESAKLGGRQCNHVQNIPDAPDISLNDVSLLPLCTWRQPPTEVTSFDVSWEPPDGAMDSSDASNVYNMTSYNIYFLWLGHSAGISENSADASNHHTEYSRFSRYSLNDVSLLP